MTLSVSMNATYDKTKFTGHVQKIIKKSMESIKGFVASGTKDFAITGFNTQDIADFNAELLGGGSVIDRIPSDILETDKRGEFYGALNETSGDFIRDLEVPTGETLLTSRLP